MAVSNSIFLQLTTLRNIVSTKNVVSKVFAGVANRMNNVSLYSTASAVAEENKSSERVPRKMSKAMMAYLERARAHDAFIQQERENYNIGKRHLANMMGEDPAHFTQKDVERSIEYLFPSGLYDKAARPVMKPPEQMFPPRKAAEFDETGRPYHSMFYTTSANYYKLLYDIVEQMEIVKAMEDSMIRKGVGPDPNDQIDWTVSDWFTNQELEKILLEEVLPMQYDYFLSTIQRLADHPYSYLAKDLIMKYRKPKTSLIQSYKIPEYEFDENGRPFIHVPDCMRKSARGSVTVKGKGSGIITVNGKRLTDYFTRNQDIEQIFAVEYNL